MFGFTCNHGPSQNVGVLISHTVLRRYFTPLLASSNFLTGVTSRIRFLFPIRSLFFVEIYCVAQLRWFLFLSRFLCITKVSVTFLFHFYLLSEQFNKVIRGRTDLFLSDCSLHNRCVKSMRVSAAMCVLFIYCCLGYMTLTMLSSLLCCRRSATLMDCPVGSLIVSF